MSTEQLIQATMTDLTMSGSGFATMPDGKQIFLPMSVVKGSGANIGDVLTCKVVPNYEDRRSDGVPWRAFFVNKVREPGQAVPDLPEGIEADILENLRTEGPATAGQLYNDLFEGKDPMMYQALANLLNQMFRAGTLSKAHIYKAGMSKSKYVFFSVSMNDLMPTEEPVLPDMM